MRAVQLLVNEYTVQCYCVTVVYSRSYESTGESSRISHLRGQVDEVRRRGCYVRGVVSQYLVFCTLTVSSY